VAERIDAPADPRLADYRHIGEPAWLKAQGLFVAEGRLVVERLLERRRFAVRSVVLTASAFEQLASWLASAAVPVYVVSPEVLERVTGFDFHRGCLALAEYGPPSDPAEWIPGSRCILGLESIANPDNVGGLFRVAEAFGAGGVILDPTSADPFYRKSIRTSMGAVLRLPFHRVSSWAAELDGLRAQGFEVVALTPHPSATPLDEYSRSLDSGKRLLIMVGAEGAGLSAAVLQLADRVVRIPIAKEVDSLNVVVAAGIALASLSAR
jgi:tRNA G18 (ribose-2'-O)-methylase SpoU